MEFKVFHGNHNSFIKNKCLGIFKSMTEAEMFVYSDIKKYRQNVFYTRVTYVSDTYRWYDYGNYTKFYHIIGI